MEQHTCRDCKQTFPLTKEFFYLYPNNPKRQKYPSYCKKCSILRSTGWYRDAHKPQSTRVYGQALHKRLDVSVEKYKSLLEQAGYRCEICGKEHSWEPRRKYERARLGIDHDHTTNRVRGILCNKCNAALGLLQDSLELVDRAAMYLRTHV